MTSSSDQPRRYGVLVRWPVLAGLMAVWVVAIVGTVRLYDHNVALSRIIEEQEDLIQRQSERIDHLEDRLRILEAVEDLQTSLSPREEGRLAHLVYDLGKAHDIPPLLVLSIIKVESSFGPRAVSSQGARGLMQVMPATGRYLITQAGAEWPGDEQLFDPGFNLWLGTRYLAHLIEKFDSVEDALIAYNWGETAVRKRLVSGEKLPKAYLRRVQREYQKLIRTYGTPASDPDALASPDQPSWLDR